MINARNNRSRTSIFLGLRLYRISFGPTLVAQGVSVCLTRLILKALLPQGELKEEQNSNGLWTKALLDVCKNCRFLGYVIHIPMQYSF